VQGKELGQRFSAAVYAFEWLHIKEGLEALKQAVIQENGERLLSAVNARETAARSFRR
jgi:hypothetical protein